MGKIIAITNQKGGVGKTTTTLSLGVGLVRHGYKVLLVDADPQGNLTTSLGWYSPDELSYTLSNLITDTLFCERSANVMNAILKHDEGVDIIPANTELSSVEARLVTAKNRETAIKNILKGLKNDYDYILIDCKPSLGMITINALTAADSVIIPVQAQYLPAKGMTQLLDTIGNVKKHLNPNLKIEGILLTLSDRRTNLSKETSLIIRKNFKGFVKVFNTEIPVATKAAESSAKGISIFSYDEGSRVAAAYEDIVKEVTHDDKRVGYDITAESLYDAGR